ncbi:MAG: hypothetical protein R3B84_22665 [Zavarzinella sp.]
MLFLLYVPIFALTKEERLVLWSGVTVVVLLLGALVIQRVDRWRKRELQAEEEPTSLLTTYREMLEEGEITRQEYDRIIQKLGKKATATADALPSATSDNKSSQDNPDDVPPGLSS